MIFWTGLLLTISAVQLVSQLLPQHAGHSPAALLLRSCMPLLPNLTRLFSNAVSPFPPLTAQSSLFLHFCSPVRLDRCSHRVCVGILGALLATSSPRLHCGWNARYAAIHSAAFAQPLVTLEQAAGLRRVPRPLSFLLTKQQREMTSMGFLHHYVLPEGLVCSSG